MKNIIRFTKIIICSVCLLLFNNCDLNIINEDDTDNEKLLALGLLVYESPNTQKIKSNLNYNLSSPEGMALEIGGKEIWLVDSGSHTIHLWNFSEGTAEIIAGSSGASGSTDNFNTLARFNNPTKVTLDDHSILVTDTGNHTIRKLHRRKKDKFLVQTYIGTAGKSGTSNTGGISSLLNFPTGIYHLSSTIFITDSSNHAIRLTYINNNSTDTLGGELGTSGFQDGTTDRSFSTSTVRFNEPSSITYLRTGLNADDPLDMRNFFILDKGNHSIRKLKNVWINDGTVSYGSNDGLYEFTTLTGKSGTSGSDDGSLDDAKFNSPNSVVSDETNVCLYVADTGNHTIRKVDLTENTVSTIIGQSGTSGNTDGSGTSALLNSPKELLLIGNHLLISDTGNNLIKEYNLTTQKVRTVLGKP